MELINKDYAYQKITELGGCNAKDEWAVGYDSGIEDALEAIGNIEPALEWIDCSERPPETSEPVLVAYHEPPFMGIKDDKLYYKVVNFVPQANAWNIKSPIEIVKWLPIPEAE